MQHIVGASAEPQTSKMAHCALNGPHMALERTAKARAKHHRNWNASDRKLTAGLCTGRPTKHTRAVRNAPRGLLRLEELQAQFG